MAGEQKIEKGMVFESTNQMKRRLVVINEEPNDAGNIEMKDEKSEARHFLSPKKLAKSYAYIGRYIPQDGEPVFVREERISSVEKLAGMAKARQALADARARNIEGRRTEDPADPPVDEAGAEGAEEAGDEDEPDDEPREEYIPKPLNADDHEYILALVMDGKLRNIQCEFKNKEARFICSCGGAQLHAGGSLKDVLEHLCAFIDLHWRHLSPMPKVDELPMRGVIRPMDAVPVAPVNGDASPAAEEGASAQ